jgi:hypothetical protein
MEDDSAEKSTVQGGSIAWASPERWNPRCTPAPTIDVWPRGRVRALLRPCPAESRGNDKQGSSESGAGEE